ncbi:dienelactone hydrolase family protein [Kineosporia sp. R_H_3]|uniref:dienelactone hydrolase family protein n=1 Tax=Kineosporia sp. R_H_3 TaxID=1961848 RepID=UPI000B4B19F0
MGEMVTFASNGSTAEGYVALPESGSGPGVIVVQEWWGLVGHIKAVADRFAAAGFVALAPDFYHGAKTDEPDEAMRLLMGLAMDRAAKDIAGAAAYLSDLEAVTSPGIGAVGFCMGGSLALWSATVAENVQAAVGFYPAVPWERMDPTWPSYAGKSAMIHCSEEDGTSSAPGIQLAKSSIEGADGEVEIFDYPGTKHAFFNDERPEVYDAAAADAAWTRTVDFFHSKLG